MPGKCHWTPSAWDNVSCYTVSSLCFFVCGDYWQQSTSLTAMGTKKRLFLSVTSATRIWIGNLHQNEQRVLLLVQFESLLQTFVLDSFEVFCLDAAFWLGFIQRTLELSRVRHRRPTNLPGEISSVWCGLMNSTARALPTNLLHPSSWLDKSPWHSDSFTFLAPFRFLFIKCGKNKYRLPINCLRMHCLYWFCLATLYFTPHW